MTFIFINTIKIRKFDKNPEKLNNFDRGKDNFLINLDKSIIMTGSDLKLKIYGFLDA